MDIKEIVGNIFNNFFIIFTCSIVGMFVYLRIFGVEFAPLHDIAALFVASILTSSAEIVLHSRKEPKRFEMFVRTALHLLVVAGIILSVATYMGWILWSVPITVIRFIGLIIGTYIAISTIVFYQTKKLADRLNEKLKERYKG